MSDTTKISMAGTINCPFPYVNKSNEAAIQLAKSNYVDWAISHGLISSKKRESFVRGTDFSRFAALTTVKIPTHPVISTNAIQSIHQTLLASEPLDSNALCRQSKWLTWLFVHDDWCESETDLNLIHRVHDSLKTIFLTGKKLDIDNQPDVVHAIQSSALDIYREFSESFTRITENDDKYMGMKVFSDMVNQYLDATEDETRDRITGSLPDIDAFELNRLHTSAVSTVYIAALIESNAKIPIDIRKNVRVIAFENYMNRVICQTNALFSAARELNTANWVHNDISVISRSTGCGYQDAVRTIFQKINCDFEESYKKLTYLPVDTTPMSIDLITYLTIVWQWGMGAIPAQLTSNRYNQGKKTPFIDELSKIQLGNNFWDYLK